MNLKLTNERGESLDVDYSHTNVHVNGSYTVAKKDIVDWVERIISCGIQNGYVYSRSAESWINEWRAHNLLCRWGIAPDRTRDVDLDENESSLRRFCYFILSKLYI